MKRFNVFLLAVIATIFVSCADDNDAIFENNGFAPTHVGQRACVKGENYELADGIEVVQLLYDNFDAPNDVTIESADSTSIQVKASLLNKMKAKIKPGNVVSIWNTRNAPPFMRRVTDIKQDGDSYALTTEDIGIEDVLKNAQLELDSHVYCDSNSRSRCADGTINNDFYTEDNDVIHPCGIWVRNKEANSRRGGTDMMYDTSKTIIVDELQGSRFGADLGISIAGTYNDLMFPLKFMGKKGGSLGIKEVNVKFRGGIHAELDISWFKVDKFSVGPYYSLEGNLRPLLSFSGDIVKKEFTEKIADFPGYDITFWVGPVPVLIAFEPSLVFGAKLEGTVQGHFGADISFKGNHHIYAVYKRDKGWDKDCDGKPFECEVEPQLGGEIKLESKMGVYIQGAVKLYKVAGPKIAFGPYVKFEAGMEKNFATDNATANVKLGMGLGGTIGAEVNIWKWKLGEWKTDFDLLYVDVLNKD
ncbi:MAG: hypothetical protein HUK05_06865, partial [Prevotella sp.]|nr:hypothetical protein [Prevotella sp.]